jgi:formylglycine-generating enzyme required for sulfatase activity
MRFIVRASFVAVLGLLASLQIATAATKQLQSISFPELPVFYLGDGSVQLNAVASSGLPVKYTSSKKRVAMVSGNVLTFKAAGKVFIKASQAGNAQFKAAKSVLCTLVVQPGVSSTLTNMALIPGGSFEMGNALSASNDGDTDELPVHTVSVSAFYMDKYEVSKALWDEVASWAAANYYDINAASVSGKATNHPVYNVTWYEAVKWSNARSQKEGLTPCYTVGGVVMRTGTSDPDCNFLASGYRLPTEAEWEKAARGGLSGKRFPWGDTITHSEANYYSDAFFSYDVSPTRGYHPTYATGSQPYSSPVGSFAPNAYGIYDTVGNMWEWCWDSYSLLYYASSPRSNPTGPASGTGRVIRGGSWNNSSDDPRTADRIYDFPDYVRSDRGFRCVRISVP